MAAIPSSRVAAVYRTGDVEYTVLYIVKNVDTLDTVDLSADFGEIKSGTFLAGGVLTGVGAISGPVSAVVLTLATMADDNVMLLVTGQKK